MCSANHRLFSALLLALSLTGCRIGPADDVPATGGAAVVAEQATLPADLGLPPGQVVLVDIWAPWDAPSRAGQAETDALAREFTPQGLAVVGWTLSGDHPGGAAPAVSYPRSVVTPEQAARLAKVRALPTRVLIDRSGRVRHVYPGAAWPSSVRTEIAALLSEKGP